MKGDKMAKSRIGLHKGRFIEHGDKRPAMVRLLQDCNIMGNIQVSDHRQWRTLFKAVKLGYIDSDSHDITEAGKAFLKTI